jgi:hypothetical protein
MPNARPAISNPDIARLETRIHLNILPRHQAVYIIAKLRPTASSLGLISCKTPHRVQLSAQPRATFRHQPNTAPTSAPESAPHHVQLPTQPLSLVSSLFLVLHTCNLYLRPLALPYLLWTFASKQRTGIHCCCGTDKTILASSCIQASRVVKTRKYSYRQCLFTR